MAKKKIVDDVIDIPQQEETVNTTVIEKKVKTPAKPEWEIKDRSYYPIVVFLSQYTIGLYNKFKYDYLKELIQEIDDAKLLEEDKNILKKRIKKEILSYYLSFIEFEQNSSIEMPPIPYIINYPMKEDIEFKRISESNFKQHYDWFVKTLG